MRRLLRIRLLVVLAALLIVPALTLPFAARLRREWTRLWEPPAKQVPIPDFVADGFGSPTQITYPIESPGPVRVEFVEGQDFIILGSPRESLPTVSGEADDYAEALAGANASEDERRRAFFEAVRRTPAGPLTQPSPNSETLDEAELIGSGLAKPYEPPKLKEVPFELRGGA